MWHRKATTAPAIGMDAGGHLWCKANFKKKSEEETARTAAQPRLMLRSLQTLAAPSPATTPLLKSRTDMRLKCKERRKNYSEVSRMGRRGKKRKKDDTHLSLRHFCTQITLQPTLQKIKGQTRRSNGGEFELPRIQDQYLSTFDNMLIICTPPKHYTSCSHWLERWEFSPAPTPDWLIPSVCKYERAVDWSSFLGGRLWLAERSLCTDPTRCRGREGKWRQANECGVVSRRIWVM